MEIKKISSVQTKLFLNGYFPLKLKRFPAVKAWKGLAFILCDFLCFKVRTLNFVNV